MRLYRTYYNRRLRRWRMIFSDDYNLMIDFGAKPIMRISPNISIDKKSYEIL